MVYDSLFPGSNATIVPFSTFSVPSIRQTSELPTFQSEIASPPNMNFFVILGFVRTDHTFEAVALMRIEERKTSRSGMHIQIHAQGYLFFIGQRCRTVSAAVYDMNLGFPRFSCHAGFPVQILNIHSLKSCQALGHASIVRLQLDKKIDRYLGSWE